MLRQDTANQSPSRELQDGRQRPDQHDLHGPKPYRELQGLRIDPRIKLADTGTKLGLDFGNTDLKPLLPRQKSVLRRQEIGFGCALP